MRQVWPVIAAVLAPPLLIVIFSCVPCRRIALCKKRGFAIPRLAVSRNSTVAPAWRGIFKPATFRALIGPDVRDVTGRLDHPSVRSSVRNLCRPALLGGRREQ